ncbi:glycosyltransferase family 4 protein [bacterium]|nr:glycosyltransferase family 4 protein [bacterium]
MKILFTHERFAPDFAGGGEYVVLETARHLRRRGVDVRVLTMGDPSVTDYEGIPTQRLAGHRYRMNGKSREIARAAADVDLIQTFNYHACYPSFRAGRTLRKPVVCQFLAVFGKAWLEMKGPWIGRAFQAYERFLLGLPFARSVFLSSYSMELARSLGPALPKGQIIAPGIDLVHYAPRWPKDPIVLFVGKLDVRKGVDDILEAARQLPHVSFLMYGWGEREASLRASAPLNVKVESFERGMPLVDRFARARVFVFPSRAETFGIAIVEAMASGCAIVSSIPVGFEGVPIVAGDMDGLVRALQQLWDDPSECERMGRVNMQRAENFTWERCIDLTIAMYEEILSAPPSMSTTSGVRAKS